MDENKEPNIYTEMQNLARDQMANAQNRLEIAQRLARGQQNSELLDKIQILFRENTELFDKCVELEKRLFGRAD